MRERCRPLFHRWPFSTLAGFLSEHSMSIQAINARNQFRGHIIEIVRGDVVSEIDVETASGIVTSVITTRSVDELGLEIGTEVVALVKSTEVSIATLTA
jgi:molybdopterin-binding protein